MSSPMSWRHIWICEHLPPNITTSMELLKSWMSEGITYSIINEPIEPVTSPLDTPLYQCISNDPEGGRS